MPDPCTAPRRVADVAWADWTPVDPATLVFVLERDRVLLIRKKRGLGAGKINAPGGRIEPGETPLACAVRETQEELCITPTGVEAVGENSFVFTDGYSIHVHVFTATGYEGEPTETDEAVPLWTPREGLPYDEMWQDDHLWVPHVFAGRPFVGRFVFEGETMLDHEVEVRSR